MSKFFASSAFILGLVGTAAAAFLVYVWAYAPLSINDARGFVHAAGYGQAVICLCFALVGICASKKEVTGILLLMATGGFVIALGAILDKTTSFFFLLDGLKMDALVLLVTSIVLAGISARPKAVIAA